MKTITSILSIFVVIVGFSEALDTCTKPCFRNYLPVCGYNKNENLYKSFSNECYLNNEHCKDNQNWVKVDDAFCKATLVEVDESGNISEVKELSAQCVTPCTREYMPVCASNGEQYKVFPNKCVMRNEHCKDHKDWVKVDDAYCKATLVEVDDSGNISEVKELSAQCVTPCTREYMPVCASNGEQYKVFPNKCVMRNEHCKDHKDWVKVDDAYCKATLVEVDNSGNISEVKELSAQCVTPCTREYMPVCASNGEQYKVFPNKCVMRNEHCKDHKEWTIVKMSMCLVRQ